MIRRLPYITVGQILDELNLEIKQIRASEMGVEAASQLTPFRRISFYRKEKLLGFPEGNKTSGGWRVYTRDEADEIKRLIKEDLRIIPSAV